MTARMPLTSRPPLHGPFATRLDPSGPHVTAAVEDLVGTQIRALLQRSPAYYELPDAQRRDMERDLTKIAAYSAALLQDGFGQAQRIGQTPVLRRRSGPVARTAADDPAVFAPRATGQVASITRDTLGAIDFPNFVAELIRGTFDAVVTASIQQMEAYGELLANVAKTVDQFMADNITDNQARDYLAARYPGHVVVDTSGAGPRAGVRPGADDLPAPDFRADLGVEDGVSLDDDTVESVLVPAARRQLAQNRHQVLATMVLMGINRIVVTSGRVRAKLDFHIDAGDSASTENASQFDARHDSIAGGWFGFGGGLARTSVAYVKTAKQVSADDINVEVDLSGELDLKFRSETFPLERFADTDAITRIQAASPNPTANPVAAPAPAGSRDQ